MTTESLTLSGARPAPGVSLIALGWTLVRTDFKTRYHGTLGGFIWALLKPFTMFLVLMVVFSFVFRTDRNYGVNLVLGLFLWEFFSESTRVGLQSLASKGYLLSKASLPPWILIVTSAANAVITLAVFSVVLVAWLAISGRAVTATGLALYGWYVVHYLLMIGGISLAGSVLLLRYRDLDQVWDMVIQAGFFLAPIIWPLNVLPERLHFYLFLWPPTPIIQFSRSVLVDGTVPTFKAHALLSLEALAMLTIGILVYRRYARRAAEYL